MELNEVVQELHVLATVPDYYSILLDLNTIQSLLHLLSHDNTDISIAVVDLLQVSSLSGRVVNDSGIGIKIMIFGKPRNQNQNHELLESESGIIIFGNPGIGIIIMNHWNRRRNQNIWETPESESESESYTTGIGNVLFGNS